MRSNLYIIKNEMLLKGLRNLNRVCKPSIAQIFGLPTMHGTLEIIIGFAVYKEIIFFKKKQKQWKSTEKKNFMVKLHKPLGSTSHIYIYII